MRYAAYGSNLHPERLRERTPSATLVGTDVVAGFTLAFAKRGRDGSGKCTLVEAPGGRVHLAVFEIDDAERPALDRAEGLGAGYTLETLALARLGPCQSYVGEPAHLDARLKPYTWYRELVLVGCELHRFPDAYLRRIASVQAVLDPDPARHELHMAIVRRARARR